MTLLAAAGLLLVAVTVAVRRRAGGIPIRRAAAEGLLFAAAVGAVYWLVFEYPRPEPWWEQDRARRSPPAATPMSSSRSITPAPRVS